MRQVNPYDLISHYLSPLLGQKPPIAKSFQFTWPSDQSETQLRVEYDPYGYTDLESGETGDPIDLVCCLFQLSDEEARFRIYQDLIEPYQEQQISVFANCRSPEPVEITTVIDWLRKTKNGIYQQKIEAYRSMITQHGKDHDVVKDFKTRELEAVTPSGTFSFRNSKSWVSASGFLVIDIDHWDDLEGLKEQMKGDNQIYAAFISPSGTGLKVVFRARYKPNESSYKAAYAAAISYLEQHYALPIGGSKKPGIDPATHDLARLCICSHDPTMCLHPLADWLPFDEPANVPKPSTALPSHSVSPLVHAPYQSDVDGDIEALVTGVEKQRIDLTTTYQDWIRVGFALSAALGERGRDYFHRLSQFHPEYEEKQTDRKYNSLLKGGNSGIGIGTLFYMAKQSGIVIARQRPPDEEPRDPPKPRLELPTFPTYVFPKAVRELIEQTAEAIFCPPDFVGIPVLSVLSIAIGATRVLELKKDYHVWTRIYTAVVAEPGSGKSPAFKAATYPIDMLQKRFNKRFKEEMKEYEEEVRIYEESLANKNSSQPKPTPPEGPPRLQQIQVDDATMEALLSLMEHNPRGILFYQDELSAWAKGMNQYRGGKGSDKEKWLSFWSGKSIIVNRRNQQPITIQDPFVSVTGCIQPDVVSELSTGKSDGFLDRILFAFPDPLPSRYTEAELDLEVKERYRVLVEQLWQLQPGHDEYNQPIPEVIYLSPRAKQIWLDFNLRHDAEVNHPDFPYFLKGIWSKLRDYTARLALILHLAHTMGNSSKIKESKEYIEASSIEGAALLSRYFKAHARKVHERLYSSPSDKKIQAAVEWLRKHEGYMELRTCYTNRIAGCRKKTDAIALFQELEDRDLGKIQRDKPSTGGREKISFILHPQV